MRLAIILLALVAGCAEHPRAPDPCKSEYRETIMGCREARKRPAMDTVEVCELQPGSRLKRCERMSREELRQILREGGRR